MTEAALEPRTGRSLRLAFRGNGLLWLGAAIVGALVVIAVFAPVIAPYPADAGSATHPLESFLAPSSEHWFGTDAVGRDVFSRGIVDNVLMRITDVFLAFPALLLALALASVLSPSVKNATLAIAVTWWPWYARLARGQAASVAGRPYIESCRALAISPWRTLFRHVLPNSVTPVIVQASLDVGGVILTAAALSFLGLGAQDPTPEWGLMVSQGQPYFTTQWWLVTFPGAAILLAALAFNLVGDGLRDRLDPRRVIGR
jgi:peptide/nickel transport system permease protein